MNSAHVGSGDRGDQAAGFPSTSSFTTGGSLGTQQLVVPARTAKSYEDELAAMNAVSLQEWKERERVTWEYIDKIDKELQKDEPAEILNLKECLEDVKDILDREKLIRSQLGNDLNPVDLLGPESLTQQLLYTSYPMEMNYFYPSTGKFETEVLGDISSPDQNETEDTEPLVGTRLNCKYCCMVCKMISREKDDILAHQCESQTG